MNCIQCGSTITDEMIQIGTCFNCGCDISPSIEAFKQKEKEQKDEQRKQLNKSNELAQGEQRINRYNEIQIQQQNEKIIITTTPIIEGYHVIGYCGLVFGETIYKLGLIKTINASLDDFADTLSFGDRELSGSSELLKQARNFAIQKMKKQALEDGANAIIGIDFESTIGSGIYHITVSGTAVRIEKNNI